MPHKHKHHKRQSSNNHDDMPAELKRTEKFYGNPMTTFAEKKPHNHRHSQEVTVNVTVNEKQDDCLTGCFKSCFSIGKSAAK